MGAPEGEKGISKQKQIDDSEGMCSSETYNEGCWSRFCNPRKNGALRDILRGLLVLIVLSIIVTIIFLVCYFLLTDIEKKETEVVNDLVHEFSSAGRKPIPEVTVNSAGYLPTKNTGYLPDENAGYLPRDRDSYNSDQGLYHEQNLAFGNRPLQKDTLVVRPGGFVPIGTGSGNSLTPPHEDALYPGSLGDGHLKEYDTEFDFIEAEEGPECEPLRLALCSDSMPWSLTVFPNIANNTNAQQLRNSLSYFQTTFIESKCSPRSREFTCSVLEPPCGPDGVSLPPCRKFCQDVSTTCSQYLPFGDAHNSVLDCSNYPDSNDPNVCVNVNEAASVTQASTKPEAPATLPSEPEIIPEVRAEIVAQPSSPIAEEKADIEVQAEPEPEPEPETKDEVVEIATEPATEVVSEIPAEVLSPDYEYAEEEVLICDHTMFLCEDGSDCLQDESVCDGIKHCLDNTDELNCSKPDPTTEAAPVQPTTQAVPTTAASTRKPSLSEMLSGSALVATTTSTPPKVKQQHTFPNLPNIFPGFDLNAKRKPTKSLADILSSSAPTTPRDVTEPEASAPEPSFLLPPRRQSEERRSFLPTAQRSLSQILASSLKATAR